MLGRSNAVYGSLWGEGWTAGCFSGDLVHCPGVIGRILRRCPNAALRPVDQPIRNSGQAEGRRGAGASDGRGGGGRRSQQAAKRTGFGGKVVSNKGFPAAGDKGKAGGRGVRVDEVKVERALENYPGMVTASQLAEHMGLTGDAPKGVSRALIALKEKGKALELRPGKWASPGTGGEFPVTVEAAPAGAGVEVEGELKDALFARFDENTCLPIPPGHRMGARPGDQGLAVRINDEHALLTRLTQRGGRCLVGTLNFAYGRANPGAGPSP